MEEKKIKQFTPTKEMMVLVTDKLIEEALKCECSCIYDVCDGDDGCGSFSYEDTIELENGNLLYVESVGKVYFETSKGDYCPYYDLGSPDTTYISRAHVNYIHLALESESDYFEFRTDRSKLKDISKVVNDGVI